MEIVAGHQPQYLPYIGFFNKIAKSDLFVYADNLQFSKKSWHNRTIISNRTGEEILLSIPVRTKDNFFQKINEVKIENNHWKRKHLKTIRLNYSKTKGFDEVFPIIEKCLNIDSDFLVDFTIPLISEFMKLLSINIPIKIGSEIEIKGEKTELLIDICKKTNYKTYLSGPGAKNYFIPELFKDAKLDHKFNYFTHPEYKQNSDKCLKGMAICDIFFYEGVNNAKKIFWKNVNENPSFE